jgi:transcriptional regulator with XRE-family HTH domain
MATAIGALIGFLRHRKGLKQNQAAGLVSMSPSTLAMYESGKRNPSSEALNKICKALELDWQTTEQLRQLLFPSHITEGSGVLSEDVMRGIPIFLRSLADEAAVQVKLKLERLWISVRHPLEVPQLDDMVRAKLAEGKTEVVYFVGSDQDSMTMPHFVEKFYPQNISERPEILRKLKCVTIPRKLRWHEFILSNPLHSEGFGRTIVTSQRCPIGTCTMDGWLMIEIANDLSDILGICGATPGKPRDVPNTGLCTLLNLTPNTVSV